MYSIRYTEQADADLFDIYVYTYETWGQEQAITYTNGLWDAINKIAADPYSPITVDRSLLSPGCRSYYQQRHLNFYRVVDQDIEILRILHDRMDIASRFSG